MTNADLFKQTFGIYATELWAKPEAEFLEWLNSEQEPKTDVLDKIRAEIDAHREELKTMADDDWYAGKIRGYDCDIEIIDKYRENEQEPKTGHWITGRSTYYDVETYRCSECKNWSPYKLEKCPNCHVRMVGENE